MVRQLMRAHGYSEAEIEARLGKEPAEKTTELSAAAAAYLESFKNGKANLVAGNVREFPRPAMQETLGRIKQEYDELGYDWKSAKAIIGRIAALEYGDMDICTKIGYDPKKGMCVIGGIGLGKTTAFKMAKKHGILRATIISSLTLKKAVSLGGYAEVEKYEKIPNVVFDDLGREGATANSYGNRIEAVADIIAARYEGFQSGKIGKTYFTTNLSLDAITETYSPHVVDRIKEMCNFYILPEAASYRK